MGDEYGIHSDNCIEKQSECRSAGIHQEPTAEQPMKKLQQHQREPTDNERKFTYENP